MLKVTLRDRIFAAVALPAALVAGYWHFVRAPLAERVARMEDRLVELGPADDLEALRPALEKRRAAALERRGKAERAEAARLAAAGAGPAAPARDDSARLRGAVEGFSRIEGLRVTASERLGGADGAADGGRLGALVRDAFGVKAPARWRFTVVADYPAVVRALDLARRPGMPAVIEGVWMDGAGARGGGPRIWKIDVRL